ncbi:MAG: sodium:proton antiporter [Desulfurococcaceae archaeon]
MDVMVFAFTAIAISFAINIAIAAYGIFTDKSLLKKLISLIIFSDTLAAFAILIGFRSPSVLSDYPSPPILTNIPESVDYLEEISAKAVDPVPQAFIITAIVINFAVFSFLLGLLLLNYKYFGSVNVSVIEEEAGDEVY